MRTKCVQAVIILLAMAAAIVVAPAVANAATAERALPVAGPNVTGQVSRTTTLSAWTVSVGGVVRARASGGSVTFFTDQSATTWVSLSVTYADVSTDGYCADVEFYILYDDPETNGDFVTDDQCTGSYHTFTHTFPENKVRYAQIGLYRDANDGTAWQSVNNPYYHYSG
jgi:hypothetical protein